MSKKNVVSTSGVTVWTGDHEPTPRGGQRLRWREWAVIIVLVVLVGYCLVQNSRRTLHSFRITGSGPSVLVTLADGKGGLQLDTSNMKDSEQVDLENIVDALVRLDTGKAAVYSSLRPEPVKLELPSTLRPRGVYIVSVTRAHERLIVAIGGRANSVRYGDQTMGSKKSLQRYGSEMVPSVLEEQRNAGLSFAGVLFGVLQLLYLLREITRK